jgi:hypothetical protein
MRFHDDAEDRTTAALRAPTTSVTESALGELVEAWVSPSTSGVRP